MRKRDFTYIDDIVAGAMGSLDNPPSDDGTEPPSKIFNLGNSRSEDLMGFVRTIERELGIEAEIEFLSMQPGDVRETLADIETSRAELGFAPRVSIEDGVRKLVAWYKEHYGVK